MRPRVGGAVQRTRTRTIAMPAVCTRLRALLAFAIVAGVGLVGPAGRVRADTDDDYAALISCNTSLDNITIGGTLSLLQDDRYYTSSTAMYHGLLFAQEWINSHSGIRVDHHTTTGHCLDVIILEDYSDATLVEQGYLELIQNYSVDFLFGPYSSDLTNISVALGEDHDLVTIAAGSSSPRVFSGRDNAFAMQPSVKTLLGPALNVLSLQDAQSIALFYTDALYTEDACTSVHKQLETYDLEDTIEVTMLEMLPNAKTSTLNNTLYAVQDLDPDIVVGCVYFDTCVTITEMLEEMQYFPPAMIMTSCANKFAYLNSTGSSGMYVLSATVWWVTMPYIGDITGWSAEQFTSYFEERWENELPVDNSVGAFAGALVLREAIENAHSIDTDEVKVELLRINSDTVYGTVEFDSINMLEADYSFVQVQSTSTDDADDDDDDDHGHDDGGGHDDDDDDDGHNDDDGGSSSSVDTNLVIPSSLASAVLEYPAPDWETRTCEEAHGAESCECRTDCPTCTDDDYDVDIASCDTRTGKRKVTFTLTSSDCVEGNGSAVPSDFRTSCDYVPVDSPAGMSLLSLVVLVGAAAIASAVWLMANRKEKEIMAAQPVFLVLFCVGGVLCCAGAGFRIGKESVASCTGFLWTLSCGFSLLFGSLISSVYRVWRIFGNQRLARVKVPVWQALEGLVFLLLIDVAALITVTVLDEISVVTTHETQHNVRVPYRQCKIGEDMLLVLSMIKVVTAALAAYLSYRTRNVDRKFLQTNYIFITIYVVVVFAGVTATISLIAQNQEALSIAQIVCIMLSVASALSFIVLPRFMQLNRNRTQQEEKRLHSGPISSGSTFTSSRDTTSHDTTGQGSRGRGGRRRRSVETLARLFGVSTASDSGDDHYSSEVRAISGEREFSPEDYAKVLFNPEEFFRLHDKIANLETRVEMLQEEKQILIERSTKYAEELEELKRVIKVLESASTPTTRQTLADARTQVARATAARSSEQRHDQHTGMVDWLRHSFASGGHSHEHDTADIMAGHNGRTTQETWDALAAALDDDEDEEDDAMGLRGIQLAKMESANDGKQVEEDGSAAGAPQYAADNPIVRPLS